MNNMTRVLSAKQHEELELILQKGVYLHNYMPRVRIDYLGLALSKFLYYAGIRSWKGRPFYAFRESPIGKGQHTQAIRYLVKKGVITYDVNRRKLAMDFLEKLQNLEEEINEKEKRREMQMISVPE